MRGDKHPITLPGETYDQRTYVPGVEVEGIVWTSGFVGNEVVAGRSYYPQDTSLQLELAYSVIGNVLMKQKLCRRMWLRVSITYLLSASFNTPGADDVRRRFFGERFPATTSIPVNRLLRPDGHVEIEMVAVKGGVREDIQVPEWTENYGGLSRSAAVKKGEDDTSIGAIFCGPHERRNGWRF
ncbi:MAG: hypothetical protein Ct9H300mP11_13880 [Chloroflexota bacterium]|nr:MAG: hypothetical protein Ct9H300mP11_13880 [Chloroflexota bacterium]